MDLSEMTMEELDDAISSSLLSLQRRIGSPMARALHLPPLAFFREELLGSLRLRYAGARYRGKDFGAGYTGGLQGVRYWKVGRERFVSFSQDLCDNLLATIRAHCSSRIEMFWLLDNLLLHEVYHLSQGMGYGNHHGLGRESPEVLLELDYQADAVAILVSCTLAWIDPRGRVHELTGDVSREDVGPMSLLDYAITANLHQCEVFTRARFARRDGESEADFRQRIARAPVRYLRFMRLLIWQYQLARARNFPEGARWADLYLMSRPEITLRNVRAFEIMADQAVLQTGWSSIEQQRYSEADARKRERVLSDPSSAAAVLMTGPSVWAGTEFARLPLTPREVDLVVDLVQRNEHAAGEILVQNLLRVGCAHWVGKGGGPGGGPTPSGRAPDGGPGPGSGYVQPVDSLLLDEAPEARALVLKRLLVPAKPGITTMRMLAEDEGSGPAARLGLQDRLAVERYLQEMNSPAGLDHFRTVGAGGEE